MEADISIRKAEVRIIIRKNKGKVQARNGRPEAAIWWLCFRYKKSQKIAKGTQEHKETKSMMQHPFYLDFMHINKVTSSSQRTPLLLSIFNLYNFYKIKHKNDEQTGHFPILIKEILTE